MLITVGQVLATHVFEARGKISNNNTGAVFTSRRTFLLIRDGLPGTLTLLIHSGSWNFVQRASHPETLAQLSGCTKIWCQGAQDDGRAPGSMIVHALAGRRTLGATGAALTMPSPPCTPHGTPQPPPHPPPMVPPAGAAGSALPTPLSSLLHARK